MTANPSKGWKKFTLKNGETRLLPAWANERLKFTFSPEEALRRGKSVKLSNPTRKLGTRKP
jgi:hypothetical protein